MATFRTTLRIIAPLILLTVIGFWFSQGAHLGWSMDRIPTQMVDEITAIAYTVYEDKFVPGLDTIAFGVAAAALCFGLSFLPPFQSK